MGGPVSDRGVILIALLTSVIAPVVLLGLNALVTRQAKYQEAAIARRIQTEDWARQDAVAAKAEAAATEAQRAAAELVAATKESIALLTSVHILVNSDYTQARRAVLEQAKATLVLLRKVVALDRAAGRSPVADDELAIRAVEKFIADLEVELVEREKAAADVVRVEEANTAALGNPDDTNT